jgi:cytochrome P450
MSPPKAVVASESVLALVAGSDTTTTVAASTFYNLLRNPSAMKRLRDEVDKYYPPGEDSLDPKHYTEMHFLEAVV